MRRRGRVFNEHRFDSGRIALKEDLRVWVETTPQSDMVYIYDNDGTASKTQGLLMTYGTKEKARKHIVMSKEKK
jgi:hypothetical protein